VDELAYLIAYLFAAAVTLGFWYLTCRAYGTREGWRSVAKQWRQSKFEALGSAVLAASALVFSHPLQSGRN
jgi:hypothetical protein